MSGPEADQRGATMTDTAHPPGRRRRRAPRRPTATPPRWPPRSRRAGRTGGSARARSRRPTRPGPLAEPDKVAGRPKLYVLDMFPYPSGIGLHVGHPLGYIATDVYGRFKRMTGHNVLHALGYDAFGLPAEQYAVQTGQHPRVTTEANIANMRAQLRRLGLAHDPRRSVADDRRRVLPVDAVDLPADLQLLVRRRAGPRPDRSPSWTLLEAERPVPARRPAARPPGRDLDEAARRRVVDAHRLAYLSHAPVNWCPGLGTVLANEEVTADGRSERGNFPVFKRNLRQWMMRITAYADAAARRPGPPGLARVDQADAAQLDRPVRGRPGRVPQRGAAPIEVFTTRPDTLFGATYMVLAPEHPMRRRAGRRRLARPTYRRRGPAARRRRATPSRPTAGPPSCDRRGAAGRGPRQDRRLHRRLRHQPGQRRGDPGVRRRLRADGLRHRRDHGRARRGRARLGVRRGVRAADHPHRAPPEGFGGRRRLHRRGAGDQLGQRRDQPGRAGRRRGQGAHHRVAGGEGRSATRTVTYKLRDWLFSRQRYWGEPFPIVYDEHGLPCALPESMLPVELPEVDDYSPRTFAEDDTTSEPEPPLGRSADWVEVTLDLGDGPKRYRRETNTMPQWAGSCWYELRYLDPTNTERFVDPEVERYWMGPQGDGRTPAASTSTSAASSTRCCTCCTPGSGTRCCSTWATSPAPSRSTGCSTRATSRPTPTPTSAGRYVPAEEVVEDGTAASPGEGRPVNREYGKMGKSLKNMVTPDDMFDAYGADTFRLYEMSMGPLDVVAAVGDPRRRRLAPLPAAAVAQRRRRGDRRACGSSTSPPDDETRRLLHRTIDGVRHDMENLRHQHRDRPADRAEQPRGQARRRCPARWPRRWC